MTKEDAKTRFLMDAETHPQEDDTNYLLELRKIADKKTKQETGFRLFEGIALLGAVCALALAAFALLSAS